MTSQASSKHRLTVVQGKYDNPAGEDIYEFSVRMRVWRERRKCRVAAVSGIELAVLVCGAVAGALMFGISGFGFALTASVIWLQAFPPARVLPLAVICPLVLNVVTLPAVRREISMSRLLPFAVGATLGIPLGVLLVVHLDAGMLRAAIGAVLITYSAFALLRPAHTALCLSAAVGRAADGGVGIVGGVMGGMTGLSVVLPSLWVGMRGWSSGQQRALLQAFGFYTQALTLVVFAGYVGLDRAIFRALGIVLPIAIVGSWAGLWIFRRLTGAGFRRVVLWTVMCGGAGLLWRAAL